LGRTVADRFGIDPARVLVTAGADDGLLRLALAYLAEGREIVLPKPTFVMIERYARLAGATVCEVAWAPGAPYPTDAVIAAITPATSLIAIVSPNNPTGAVATAEDVRRVADAAPEAVIIVDCAYAEFADEDLTSAALEIPNAVCLRTMSKAYGCAGLRVGFALGDPEIIEALGAAGNPYPCAAPSLAAAAERLTADISSGVSQVRSERKQLVEALDYAGLEARPSEGNFVYAEGPRALLTAELLAGLGIAVRRFPGMREGLPDAIRVTCPGDAEDFERLTSALQIVASPEALLFDMDGVLVDVSSSYRRAIVETARAFGVEVTADDIARIKAAGDANDDWRVTWRLVNEAKGSTGDEVTLQAITEAFEARYQGTDSRPGLKQSERLLIAKETLEALRKTYRLGVVTGRPRSDAEFFLESVGLTDTFEVVVTREDAELKPSPAPTRLACERLGIQRAWLLGDTPDDITSARGAGVLGIGVIPPGEEPSSGNAEGHGALTRVLRAAGAGAVLTQTNDLLDLLP
ncbi:MAG: TIGR01548 family HAD-type hydrolase, partial [Planctomycetota bacterium]